MKLVFLLIVFFNFMSVNLFANYREEIPKPIYDANPDFVDLYYKTWEIAATKVKEQPGLPQTPYMDEGLWDDTIWIWDTCFMSLFTKYAPNHFPGVESLRNFYETLHAHQSENSPLVVWHPDNPPLFAWVEYDQFRFHNRRGPIETLLTHQKYLQKHYHWFNSVEQGWQYTRGPKNSQPVYLKQYPLGFSWNGIASGMDNTPRGRGAGQSLTLWVDAISQQGLSALYISRLLNEIGETEQAAQWKNEYERLKTIVNQYYWDERDGFYYDISLYLNRPLRVMTPASFWPVLAEMASPEQVERMVAYLEDPLKLGGNPPIVSLARDDLQFKKNGNYWRGSLWLPMAYMTIKGIEKYGYHDLARQLSTQIVAYMEKTYREVEPHTIWECYSPTEAGPAMTATGLSRCRADFCGWSALGPISLFIENIIGIYQVDAVKGEVYWDLPLSNGNLRDRCGLNGLTFGSTKASLLYDEGVITVSSNQPFTLFVNENVYKVKKGENRFQIQ